MPADASAMAWVRAAALSGFEELVSAHGGDPAAILQRCGLSLGQLADPERYLPNPAVALAIEEAARVLEVRDFGLRLCARQGVETLGLLGLIIQSARTVRDGMMQGARYVHFHNPTLGYRTFMAADAGLEYVEVYSRQPHGPATPQVTEICVAFMVRLVALLSEGGLRPAAIQFRHAPVGSREQYRRHLGLQPHFRAAFDGIAIDPLAWRQPMPSHNRLLQQFVERFLLQASAGPDGRVADQVLSVLGNLLRLGMADLAAVARVLDLHPRTLQRRLQAEGVVFETLRDTARQSWARQLLAQPGLSLAQIAELLGYADQAVLTRACQRWFGATPGRLRADARQAVGGTP